MSEGYRIPQRFRCLIPDYCISGEGTDCGGKQPQACRKKEVMIKHMNEKFVWFFIKEEEGEVGNKLKKEENEIAAHV